MGSINTLLQTSIDAIEETCKNQNDDYHFKTDTNTRAVDDHSFYSFLNKIRYFLHLKNSLSTLYFKHESNTSENQKRKNCL